MNNRKLNVESIGNAAIVAIFWSLVQSWGGRFSTFILFVILARFLDPSQYGIVQAALLILSLVTIVAEFGFGDAIIQNNGLEPTDINVPFYLSMFLSCLLALITAVFSDRIETLMGVQGLSAVIIVLCGIAPLTTLSSFQEMNYRKQLAFKGLAIRVFVVNVIAGPIAVFVAYFGGGVWSLVAQAYLSVAVGAAWLWMQPKWLPGTTLRLDAFWGLFRFGLPVVALRVADFAAVRFVDIIILNRFGLAFLGLYAVGSRLYQVLMQVLQSALNDVSLSVLSKISDDRERMAEIYTKAISIAAYIAAPIFVLFASISPEVCSVLFGHKWEGVDVIARPLLLLGAVQCVQYLNGPYISARGKPNLVFKIALVKYLTMIIGLYFIPAGNVKIVVTLFALLQMVATPMTFYAISRDLNVSLLRMLKILAPAIVACVSADFLVGRTRVYVSGFDPFISGSILGFVFFASYMAVSVILGRKQYIVIKDFVLKNVLKRTQNQ